MRSEWEIVKLGNVTSKIGSGSTPRGGSKVYLKDGECALFRSQNVLNNSFSKNGLVYIDSEAAKKLQNVNIERSDVLLNITGDSVARVCKAPCEYLPARVNQHVAIIRTIPSKLNSSYLNYYLNSRSMQNYMLTIASAGATRNALTKGMIEDFDISAPSLQTQKKIAHILSTLDDKIELNSKMNQTLEEMAQSIFKSWFVDFDPVHAKANLGSNADYDQLAKELGISRETLDSFPNEFEESEFGTTPKGWEVTQLGACDFTIESGRRPKGGIDKELKNGTPSVGAESIISTGGFNFSKVKYVTHEFALKAKKGWVQNMDVALYKDGGKPGIFMPRVGLYGRSFPFKSFMINEHVFLLRSKQLGQYFLYGLITSDNILNQLISKGSAKAAQPGLNQTEVKSSKFIFPSVELIESFNKVVKPMVAKQLENGKQIQALQQTRDLLLPKLLSGELDVSELELDNVTH
jgi:type I restriction enzyme, S subunit